MAELQAGDPQRIGPYVLMSRLGSGGMGRVYLARSPGGRQVAVKVIRSELADDDAFRARFAREVTAARTVGGLFTAQVVDADVEGPVPWLVTAFVPGLSLADAVDQGGPLPPRTVLALATGLAEGLNAIHAAGVIHRDLKPSNVLLALDGPRIIDFGISSAAEATALTGTGLMIGSPGYMSPEQAEGQTVGPASDIFSLAGVLTFAIRGEGPFGVGDTTALLYRVVHGMPNLDGIPARLQPVISWCLSKEAVLRPSASEFLAELTAAYPGAADLTGWLPPRLRDAAAQRDPAEDSGRVAVAAGRGVAESAARPAVTAATGQGGVQAGAPGPGGDLDRPPWWPQQPTYPWRPMPPVRRRRRGLWVSLIATVCAAVIAALVVRLGASHTGAPARQDTNPARSVTPPTPAFTPTVGYLTLAQLRDGDCLTGADLQLDTAKPWPQLAEAVPCTQRHTAEVFLADDTFWAASLGYPGDGAIVRIADAACNSAFRSYVGIAYDKSVYTWTNLFPDAQTWRGGDRALHCVAYWSTRDDRAGAYLTGSIRGSRR